MFCHCIDVQYKWPPSTREVVFLFFSGVCICLALSKAGCKMHGESLNKQMRSICWFLTDYTLLFDVAVYTNTNVHIWKWWIPSSQMHTKTMGLDVKYCIFMLLNCWILYCVDTVCTNFFGEASKGKVHPVEGNLLMSEKCKCKMSIGANVGVRWFTPTLWSGRTGS